MVYLECVLSCSVLIWFGVMYGAYDFGHSMLITELWKSPRSVIYGVTYLQFKFLGKLNTGLFVNCCCKNQEKVIAWKIFLY